MPTDRPGGRDAEHRVPTWVKAFVVAGLIALLVVLVVVLSSGGHGPARHQAAAAGADAPRGPMAPDAG